MKSFNKVGVESNMLFGWSHDQVEAMCMELANFINTTAQSSDAHGKTYIASAKALCDTLHNSLYSGEPVKLSPAEVNNLITIFSYDSMIQRAMSNSIEDFMNTQYAPMIESVAKDQEDEFKTRKDEIIKASQFALTFNEALIAYIKNPKSKKAKMVADALDEDPKKLDAMRKSIEESIKWNTEELDKAYNVNPLKDVPKFNIQYGVGSENPFENNGGDREGHQVDDFVDHLASLIGAMAFSDMMRRRPGQDEPENPDDED